MDGTGRAESGTEAESNAWSSCRERSETQQMHQAARLLLSCKVLGFTSFNRTYRVRFYRQSWYLCNFYKA